MACRLVRRQAIIWTNAGILVIGPLWTNFSEILIDIHTFSFKKMHLKMSSAKWRPFCLGPNVLRQSLCSPSNWGLCTACWACFMCHYELWPKSVSESFLLPSQYFSLAILSPYFLLGGLLLQYTCGSISVRELVECLVYFVIWCRVVVSNDNALTFLCLFFIHFFLYDDTNVQSSYLSICDWVDMFWLHYGWWGCSTVNTE